MGINELHASHIRKVEVAFVISGYDLNPEEVSIVLGIQPDYSVRRGDEKRNFAGDLLGTHSEGIWSIDSKGKIESKDINEHFHYLLSVLLPHLEEILKFAKSGETYFDVLWQSTYLYAGTGPVIERDCLQGISQLQASMGFDIYQIDDETIE